MPDQPVRFDDQTILPELQNILSEPQHPLFDVQTSNHYPRSKKAAGEQGHLISHGWEVLAPASAEPVSEPARGGARPGGRKRFRPVPPTTAAHSFFFLYSKRRQPLKADGLAPRTDIRRAVLLWNLLPPQWRYWQFVDDGRECRNWSKNDLRLINAFVVPRTFPGENLPWASGVEVALDSLESLVQEHPHGPRSHLLG